MSAELPENAKEIGDQLLADIRAYAESQVEDLEEAKEAAKVLSIQYVELLSATATAKSLGQDTRIAEASLAAAFSNLKATIGMEAAAKVKTMAVEGLAKAAGVVIKVLALL